MLYDFYLNLEHPLIPHFKPAAGAAIASAIGAIAAAGISYAANERSNKKNEELMNEQLSYQTQERLDSQAYNSPSAQSARYQAAGINPYMALGNLSSGNTNFQTGVQAPDIKPNNALADMAQQLGETPRRAQELQLMSEQITAQNEANYQAHIESINKEREKHLDLTQKSADISATLAKLDKDSAEASKLREELRFINNQIKMSEIDLEHHQSIVSNTSRKLRNEADLVYEQKVGQQSQNAYQEYFNSIFPKLTGLQMENIKAATTNAYSEANLKARMSEHEIEKKALTITENQIQTLNKFNVRIEQTQKRQLNDANLRYIRSMTRKVRNMDNAIQNYSPLAGIAAAGAAAAF